MLALSAMQVFGEDLAGPRPPHRQPLLYREVDVVRSIEAPRVHHAAAPSLIPRLSILVIPPADWSPPIRYRANTALAGMECNSIN
jgi:hypothetical protein